MDNINEAYFSKELGPIIKQMENSKGLVEAVKKAKRIGIKVHFGEMGSITYLKPSIAKQVYDSLRGMNPKAEINLIESNVLYKGSRTYTSDHIKTALAHGFDFAPIDICDDKGDWEIKSDKKLKHFDKAYFGKSLKGYDFIFAVSHVKGHIFTGFAGSIKNIGMGLASRKGKFALHSNIKPESNPKKCIACGKCIEECPAEAISFVEGKAFIDRDKCIGCAHCIAVCPQEAIDIHWESVKPSDLQERIAEYSRILMDEMGKGRFAFLNVMQSITKDCDCIGNPQKIEMQDIGFILSTNMLAADKASFDMVNKAAEDIFRKMHPHVDPESQFRYSMEIGLGSGYKLISLD
jgi:hypothetical protein